ncbi:hypothetical protein A3Q29_00245 [Providencia stuartii]|uniref:Lipoprotein n=1 Tax=Providencia stuartii TaxID=588 RepID=A0A1S1HVY2_PROST|nr:hypothetical protein A3Q29_00245 [Providencia stuartii]
MVYEKGIRRFVLCLSLSGCTVKKEMFPVGGSKADGTVTMAYSFGEFEKPIVDAQKAKEVAAQKCKVWGYADADPFGGQTTNCTQRGGFGSCSQTEVRVQYQCIGGKASEY